jgi:hypothetical protein
MIAMNVAREVAYEATAPIAYVMAAQDDFHVGRCLRRRGQVVCPARVYGAEQNIALKVREFENPDGSIGYRVFGVRDVTPDPDPAPVR